MSHSAPEWNLTAMQRYKRNSSKAEGAKLETTFIGKDSAHFLGQNWKHAMVVAAYLDGEAHMSGQPFDIHRYRMVMSVDVYCKGVKNFWVGLSIQLCPGQHDNNLHWPFKSRFTLTVHHQSDEHKDVSKTITPSNVSRPETSKKPHGQCNPRWGDTEIIRFVDAEVGGFVYDDSISVSVKILPD
ncbi:TNF receptor-associated factor 3-like [Ornithodoros turicata]|uniref:TNF receptor-associated factor 3-like n=1 Tax=Ornithodoros turicata TaxID=34597 RepID=UPI003138909B